MADFDFGPLLVGLTFLVVVVIALVILICCGSGMKICQTSNTEETRDLICHSKTFAVTTSFLTEHHETIGSSNPLSHPGPNSGTYEGGRMTRLGTLGDINDLPSYGAVLASGPTASTTDMTPPLYTTVVNEGRPMRPVSGNMLRVTDDVPPPPYPGTESII